MINFKFKDVIQYLKFKNNPFSYTGIYVALKMSLLMYFLC